MDTRGPLEPRAAFRIGTSLRALPVGLLLVLLGATAALALLFWSNRDYHLRRAEIDGANLAWVLESHLDATLRRVDAGLSELAAAMSPEDMSRARAAAVAPRISRYLRKHQDNFPEVRGIHAFDAGGEAPPRRPGDAPLRHRGPGPLPALAR